MAVRAIILAGGVGKRFWPLSRCDQPKQLLPLFDGVSMLQRTIDAVTGCADDVSVSTGKDMEKQIRVQMPGIHLIVEPERRDTAAAIGLCGVQFPAHDMLLFIPSDAYMSNQDELIATLNKAIALSQKSQGVVLVGINPTYPSTAYGYLEPGDDSYVLRFHEKPAVSMAEEYVKNGFLWNAGIFVVRASVLLDLYRTHQPQIHALLEKIDQTGNVDAVYHQIPITSFDYAILQNDSHTRYVRGSFEWKDVGNFDALAQVLPGSNKVLSGCVAHLNSSGNLVRSDKQVALVDCHDLIVVDTPDVLLVCPRSSAQRIKELVDSKIPRNLL